MMELHYIKCEEYLLVFNDTGRSFTSVNRRYHGKEIGWSDGYITLKHKGVTRIAYHNTAQLAELDVFYILYSPGKFVI